MHSHLLISQSDRQCFSHEDECLLPVTKYESSLPGLAGCIGSTTKATKFPLQRPYSCLWPTLISSGLWQRQLNSRFKGHIVAFDQHWFHRVYGRGNWIPAFFDKWLPLVLGSFIGSTAEATVFLLSSINGCLWSWWAWSGLQQRQLYSRFKGHLVAFDQHWFHRVYGRGNWIPASKAI